MASSLKLVWVAVLLAAMVTSCMVRAAPTGAQEQDVEKFEEAVVEAEKGGNLGEVEEAVEDALAEDEKIDKEEITLARDDPDATLREDEQEKEEIVEDAMDEVINEGKEDVIEDLTKNIIDDDDSLDPDDVIVTGSSSQPDASDYLWEPSYDNSEIELYPWLFHDPPNDPSQWSSNFEIFDEEYLPYYESSYQPMNEAEDNRLDNHLSLNILQGGFNGVPGEELNNKVEQTMDEFLCMLGLCDDIRVYPEDEEWEEPNEIRFTEEGMMGNRMEEESDEKDIYPVDAQSEDQKAATNSSAEAEVEDTLTSRVKRDGQSSPEGGRHRSKRDLSWDELEQDGDLLSKINSLDRLHKEQEEEAEEEKAQGDPSLTAADRFEDLLQYFKDEAAKAENDGEEEQFYLGVPEPVLNEIVRDTTRGEIQNVIEEEALEEAEDLAGIEDGIEEAGEFVEDDEDLEDGDAWGAYLVPGSPYIKDTLKYDGYKRDDEKEALKVYIESLQNLEGYRKRAEQRDDDSRSAANLLRQLVPRSPPDAVRYPKTGLEPFSREKYFPFFSGPNGMADDKEMTDDINPATLLEKYNELMDLFNAELEEAVLISALRELGKDQQLLDQLAQEEAEQDLQLALDVNNKDILDLVGIGSSRPIKRAPRVIDYKDFTEYPPELHRRSLLAPSSDLNALSQEDLIRLYEEYINEAAEEAKWGDFIDEPRERREGEDSLPGPHGAYYVQGRMLGSLMKPKRDWKLSSKDLPAGPLQEDSVDNPYILLDPSDLGYEEWPGDFEIFFDMRDGTYVVYPYPEPQDASVLSNDALLDALGLSGRNFVNDAAGDVDGETGDEWGDFIDGRAVLQNDLKNIQEDINKLEDLQILTAIAQELQREEEEAEEEEDLLQELLGE
ncbi:uncharacterized protein LOC110974585 [Acanthaster planci]|uniref:Uncharacterized protein LOC110974585 n=1 Tax=Acanthaster planci TaxID=133434 RepID=A0A8B7XPV3_ACAPL|nr:uncharacterized protein LOC110974585 [Acanthaster planci]